ncbi:MAG: hypothetical protein U1D55_09650 [Phycisphaerae bacterium]
MVLNIIILVLVGSITFMHSIFGLYSGVVNLFCTVISAAAALGLWEPIAAWAAKDIGLPAGAAPYMGPVTIILLFTLTLTLLRVLADNYLRGNVHVPMYVDWGGGAVCGLTNALLTVGVLVIGFRMLPLGDSPLGYSSFVRTEDKEDGYAVVRGNNPWLSPDSLAVGLVRMLSSGSLRGETTLASVYPDMAEWVRWSGNVVQVESSPAPLRDKGDGFTQGLEINSWWEQKEPVKARYREHVPDKDQPLPPFSGDRDYRASAGKRLLGARLTLKSASADRVEKGPSLHLFRPSMIRIVGIVGDEPRQYFPRILGGADEMLKDARRVVDADNNFALAGNVDQPIDVFFEVDEQFKPHFIEYRRFARAGMPATAASKAATPAVAGGFGGGPGGGGQTQQQSGAMSFMSQVVGNSGDQDTMPRDLSTAQLRRNLDAELSGEAFVSGRISGDLERFDPQGQAAIKRFKVPDGFRLCQIRYRPRQAATTAGQVFNYVARTINQYHVSDNTGDKHMLVGYYAIVKRGGKDFIEIFYTGKTDDPTYKAMLDFKEIKPSELTNSDENELGLLFLVPPGRTVLGVHNQGGQGIDMSPGFPMSGQ